MFLNLSHLSVRYPGVERPAVIRAIAEARSHGLVLTRRVEMPANNLMLLFRRG
mgnify:CR=1 FL=1